MASFNVSPGTALSWARRLAATMKPRERARVRGRVNFDMGRITKDRTRENGGNFKFLLDDAKAGKLHP